MDINTDKVRNTLTVLITLCTAFTPIIRNKAARVVINCILSTLQALLDNLDGIGSDETLTAYIEECKNTTNSFNA